MRLFFLLKPLKTSLDMKETKEDHHILQKKKKKKLSRLSKFCLSKFVKSYGFKKKSTSFFFLTFFFWFVFEKGCKTFWFVNIYVKTEKSQLDVQDLKRWLTTDSVVNHLLRSCTSNWLFKFLLLLIFITIKFIYLLKKIYLFIY